MLTQVPNVQSIGEEVARDMRHQHLPAVRHASDARAPVDVDPDVALGCQARLARVDAYADADGTSGEGRLRRPSRRNGVRRTREDDEECIALWPARTPSLFEKAKIDAAEIERLEPRPRPLVGSL